MIKKLKKVSNDVFLHLFSAKRVISRQM